MAFDPKSGQIRIRLKSGQTNDLQFMSLSEVDREYVRDYASEDK